MKALQIVNRNNKIIPLIICVSEISILDIISRIFIRNLKSYKLSSRVMIIVHK